MKFRCTVCAYLHEGAAPPEACPVCDVGPELFEELVPASPATPELSTADAKTWVCTVCAYEVEGSEPPATCPVCGVGPELFEAREDPKPKALSAPPPSVPEPAPAEARAWRCTVCAYVHEGDAAPDVCPVCGVGPELFEPVAAPAPAARPEPSGRRIVIVGAGVAACAAASAARQVDPGAAITMVSGEPGLPYRRIDLTRFLAGQVDDLDLTMHDDAWFREQRVDRVVGDIRSIDLEGRRARLGDGRGFAYDRLVLANGAHAFVPPILGVTRAGVSVLRTLDHARRVLQRCRRDQHCVVVGGGLLGLEAAVALAGRGARVTVLEGQPWLLPRQLTEPAGILLQARLEKLGVSVRCGVRVREIAGDESVYAVVLDEGIEVPAELVLLSTGVRPNAELAGRAGLDVARGVVVDDTMTTSDPAVLAAGDVAEHAGRVYGLWPMAHDQGQVAGVVAAGGQARFEAPPPATMLKVLDVPVASIGEVNASGEGVVAHDERLGGRYLRIVTRNGRLVGACLYGDVVLAGALRRAIQEGEIVEEPADFLTVLRVG